MKANFSDTNDFVQSMNRGKRKKKIALLVLCIVLAFLVAACVVVGLKIRENNRIAMAKSVITKLDISTTFKESEFSDDQDWDGDGIKNADEVRHGTNLQSEDTDNDGISDGDEIKLGTNPIEADTATVFLTAMSLWRAQIRESQSLTERPMTLKESLQWKKMQGTAALK